MTYIQHGQEDTAMSTEYDPVTSPCVRARDLLALLGGPAEATRLLHAAGYDRANESTVRAWQHRNIVPTGWLVALKSVARRRGINVQIDSFLIDPR